ncbi:MAG: hypothetical protein Q8N09_11845 [Thermodesulfovibrionia bacterium]|nr:hypothetical protein [Thermodesulfovibrionia bacterium]
MSRTDQVALPYHWIRLKSSGTMFLDRIEKIVKTHSAIKPERFKESWLDRLFIPVRNSKHCKDLQIDVSVESKRSRLVRIDARADWRKDPPSPELYDEIVSKYFTPCLEKYNKQHKATLQLEKGYLYTGRSNLPPEATILFKRFVALSLHKYKPPEWESLYRFIRHCHAYKIKFSTSDLIHFLREAGFTEESSKQIAKVYAHGRNILSFFKPKRAFFQVYFD